MEFKVEEHFVASCLDFFNDGWTCCIEKFHTDFYKWFFICEFIEESKCCFCIFKVKCNNMEFSLSGVQNKVQQFHEKHGIPAETAGYALRCVAKAVYLATEQALKAYPGLPVVFSGGVASNSMLREVIAPLKPIFAQPQFSTDNAMGVAVLAHRITEE